MDGCWKIYGFKNIINIRIKLIINGWCFERLVKSGVRSWKRSSKDCGNIDDD